MTMLTAVPEPPVLSPEHPSVIDLIGVDDACNRSGRTPDELAELIKSRALAVYLVAGSLRFRLIDIVALAPAAR